MGSRLGERIVVARIIVLALLVSSGCDGLSERPGQDFSVRVLDRSPIALTGQIQATVRFAVSGCSEFDLALVDSTLVRHPISFMPRADGSFDATVPVSWMQPPDGSITWCQWEPEFGRQPVHGTLIVICHDVERSATAEFSMQIATATRALDAWPADVRAVFSSDDPLLPWRMNAYGTGGAFFLPPGRYSPGTPWLDWRAAEVNPLVRPRLARRGDRVFVTLGCERSAPCPPGNERLAEIALSDGAQVAAPARSIAHVPPAVIDMAYASDGSLVVLSQTGDLTRWTNDTSIIVSRVEPAPDGAGAVLESTVSTIAELPRHAAMGRLIRNADGDLEFFTLAFPEGLGPIVAVLNDTDGHAVGEVMTTRAVGYVDAERTRPLGRADLSPDGSSMVVTDEKGTYWVSTDPSMPWWEPFTYSFAGGSWESGGGLAWLPGAVAVWEGHAVEVLDTTRPFGLRWEYSVEPLPGATVPPRLLDVTAVGDKLVLTTSTGIRILGPDGTLMGGSDPLPCGAIPTAVAERTGPTTVAVGAGRLVYVFDVGAAPSGESEGASTKP